MYVEKVFFCLVATVCDIGSYADSVFTRNVLLDNRRVCDASSYVKTSLPLDQCARLCHSDSSCMSLVYNRNDGRCELLSRIHVDPEVSYSEPGNVEFRKRDAESVCDIPTSIVNGRVLHTNGLVVGSKAEFICDDFHMPTTENGICDLSGEWVGLDTPCRHTLLSPYNIPAVDKIRQGSCLVVTATPTANTRLLLQKVSTDVNFLFAPRFTPESNPEIVRNTKINGIWGSAEMNLPFWPFAVNQEFNLTVCAEETMFRIHVDNEEMFTYAYRRPLSEITFVLLNRDVALRRIRFVVPAGTSC